MEFKYKAKKSLNEIIEGKIEADSVERVIAGLESQGMTALSVEAVGKAAKAQGKKAPAANFGKWGLKQQTLFTRKLYNLSKANVELLSALRLLREASNNSTEMALLDSIIRDIKDGTTFSQCLKNHPQYFSELYVNIIRTGENSGQLKDAFAQILNHLSRLEALKVKVQQALAYPIFMVAAGIGTVFVMLTFILPRLSAMFEDLGGSLPLPTVILLNISGFLKQYWLWIFIGIGAVIAVLRHSRAGFFSSLKYRLPLLKNVVYKQSIANFSRSTSILLKSGVTLLSAIGFTASIVGNPVYVRQLKEVCQKIKDGDSFSHALSSFKIFPDFFVQMIRVGEEGGRLDSVLSDIADAYEEEIDGDLKVISSLLEPAIILCLGLVIGGMVIAMLLPIFNINMLVGS